MGIVNLGFTKFNFSFGSFGCFDDREGLDWIKEESLGD